MITRPVASVLAYSGVPFVAGLGLGVMGLQAGVDEFGWREGPFYFPILIPCIWQFESVYRQVHSEAVLQSHSVCYIVRG